MSIEAFHKTEPPKETEEKPRRTRRTRKATKKVENECHSKGEGTGRSSCVRNGLYNVCMSVSFPLRNSGWQDS